MRICRSKKRVERCRKEAGSSKRVRKGSRKEEGGNGELSNAIEIEKEWLLNLLIDKDLFINPDHKI